MVVSPRTNLQRKHAHDDGNDTGHGAAHAHHRSRARELGDARRRGRNAGRGAASRERRGAVRGHGVAGRHDGGGGHAGRNGGGAVGDLVGGRRGQRHGVDLVDGRGDVDGRVVGLGVLGDGNGGESREGEDGSEGAHFVACWCGSCRRDCPD